MGVGIHHICVVTPDLDKSIDFYTRLLGFSFVNRDRLDAAHIEIANVVAGGADVEFIKFTDERPNFHYGDGLIEMICIEVDDIFSVSGKLRAEGVEFLMDEPGRKDSGDYFTFLRGPSGEKLALLQISKADC
ncbi:MAG: VOC family protein [Oscillospiraceae bacterium]|jgi:catechol 2,3-dioxygenase-like lactoylglutathione lyase family enzyme|nr:VOC family protein [Oscillospiraceae bacterium]